MVDIRSSLIVQILQANPQAYEMLLVHGDTPALAKVQLENIKPEQLLGVPVTSQVAAYSMLAGLWLWHDGLRECHEIVQNSPESLLAAAKDANDKPPNPLLKIISSQSVESKKSNNSAHLREMESTLCFWHAIMHRREGDFGNSKYWYAKCRSHPIMPTLASLANEVIAHAPADKALLKLTMGPWNGSSFVDFVQEVHESPSDSRYSLAIAIQQLEWRTLFDHCARSAVG